MSAKSKRQWITPAVLAVALCALPGCERTDAVSDETKPEVSVTVIRPVMRELPRFTRVTGTLHGEEEATIAAKVAGRVAEVLRDLGDSAAPGDALIRIDPIDYELARTEREHAFVEALAKLGLHELPKETFDVNALPSVERARLQAANAKARLERARVLTERKPPLISAQDFADLETTYQVAQSNLKVERLTAEATLAEARTLQAQVDIAQQRVSDAVHRAPDVPAAVDEPLASNQPPAPALPRASDDEIRRGRVYEVAQRMVTVGDFVQIGSPLMRLVDADPLKLRVPIPERRLGTVRKDQPVAVRVEAFDRDFEGRVSRISPAVDTATRTFAVEILVSNPERVLKPGSFATAEIEVGREPALMVPEAAIVTFAGVHKVVLVRDGKAQEQPVELGQRADGMAEILEGIGTNDPVIMNPPGSLTTGTPVTVSSDTKPSEPVASAGQLDAHEAKAKP